MQLFQQSEGTAAQRRMLVYLVDDTDGKTAKTGQTPATGEIKISKDGNSEGNHAGVWTELAGGLYVYEFTAGELDTLGFVSFRLVKTNCRTFVKEVQVVPWDPYDAQALGVGAFDDIMNKTGGGGTYDQTTDSLEALRDTLATKTEVATEVWTNATRWTLKKGSATYFEFLMVDETNGRDPETSLTGITAKISKDGGGFATCTNEASIAEINYGYYKISLTATEMTADRIILLFTKTGCWPARYQILTEAMA